MVLSRYRIWCVTEGIYVYAYAATEPTTCPNNAAHTIDSTKTAVVEQRDPIILGKTADYTMAVADFGSIIRFTGSSSQTLTLCALTSNEVGQSVEAVKDGTGNLVVSVPTGYTLYYKGVLYTGPTTITFGDTSLRIVLVAMSTTQWHATADCRALRQTTSAKITADTSMNSTTFADLLSVSITTTAGGVLLARFSGGFGQSTTNGQGRFKLLIDGVIQNAAGFTQYGSSAAGAIPNPMALSCRLAVSAGSHTVTVQWATGSSGNTISCKPVTYPNYNGASLVVEEVGA